MENNQKSIIGTFIEFIGSLFIFGSALFFCFVAGWAMGSKDAQEGGAGIAHQVEQLFFNAEDIPSLAEPTEKPGFRLFGKKQSTLTNN